MNAADIPSLAARLCAGERRALARAITLAESTRADHRERAAELLALLMPHTGRSIRIGISGVPGVGKSTFIEALGNHIIDAGHRVAALAVDPSSAISGGSILGDKTRMEVLSRRPEAFIRPSPSGGTLGGVARRTREAILLCEAGGFDVILVETVGVGQSETAVADMTDMFVLLLVPSGGDELQGIKRGIVELADFVIVNKADGELLPIAQRTAGEYANALHLLRRRDDDWRVPVQTCSAIAGTGVAEAWNRMQEYCGRAREAGRLASRRANQARAWMWADATDALTAMLRSDAAASARVGTLEAEVTAGRLAPSVAARELLELFLRRR
ncbi:MAG: methylmalonyl Co-A mutase-associated GTPase MeaB [Gammaproteobacteria bacterium]